MGFDHGPLLALATSPYWLVTGLALAMAAVLFLIGAKYRALIDAALNRQTAGKPRLRMLDLSRGDVPKVLRERQFVVPERLWSYDAVYLEKFAAAARDAPTAGYGTALELYRRVLSRWDLGFAVALAVFIGLACFGAASYCASHPYVGRALLVLASMGILYGFADAAEDIKLASILAHPGDIDMGEAAAANVLTRLKFVTITLSVVGLVVFAILSAIALVAGRAFRQQTNIEKLPGRT